MYDKIHYKKKKNLILYKEGRKGLTLVVCLILLLKREKEAPDTCSLFPLFGDP